MHPNRSNLLRVTLQSTIERRIMERPYRRLMWSTIWHFCRDCHYWPTDLYIERTEDPDTGRPCQIRQPKEDHRKCEEAQSRSLDNPLNFPVENLPCTSYSRYF